MFFQVWEKDQQRKFVLVESGRHEVVTITSTPSIGDPLDADTPA